MKEFPEPEVIYTHESDLDGFVAGTLLVRLARRLFDREPPLKAFHYGAWENHQIRQNRVWISDLTFEDRLDHPQWVVFDHHHTRATPKKAQLVHNTELSAGSIVYQLLREAGGGSDALDRLVHLNNVADLFLREDPDFGDAIDLASMIKVYGFWSIHGLTNGDPERILDLPLRQVIRLKREVENPLGFEWSKGRVTEITPEVGLVDTAIGDSNMIVHQMLQERVTPFPVLMTLSGRGAGGGLSVSLRSENGEALPVAQRLQGGGHPNACGASLPKTIHHAPDAIVYLKKTLNPPPAIQSEREAVESLFDGLG